MSLNQRQSFIRSKLHIDVILLICILILLIYSVFIIWSATGQNISMLEHKIIQNIIGLFIMLLMAQIEPRIYEIYAPYLYLFCILLLILVDHYGQMSNGAQRWLEIGYIRFEPSELAKIAVPLMIVRIINRSTYPPTLKSTIIILIFICLPVLLIASQPDLGTAILIFISGLFILFLAGTNWKIIITTIFLISCSIPIVWYWFMHDYQRDRIMVMLDPEIDPLGSGYHIIQSKIAIGSAGFSGKGWLQGTQSQLRFLPERHTDFIFAVLDEEFGLIGVLVLLSLYLSIIIRGLIIAVQAQNIFGRVMVGGLILILFFYIAVNIGMVSGILPIVGVPLPLVSYGGSASIVLMSNFGIIMSIHTHRKMLSKIL